MTRASADPSRRSSALDRRHARRSAWTTSAATTASTGNAIITSTRTTAAPGCAARRAGPAAAPAASRDRRLIGPASSRSSDRVGAGLVDDDAVAQEDDPVGPGGVPRLVGDEHAGRAGVAAGAQQPQDVLAGLGVQRAGRLVGQHQPALADQRPGDRHPLLLAAGHLVGEAVGEVGEPDLARARRAPAGGRCARRSPSSSSGSATFSTAVSAGIRLKSWKT